MTTAFDISAQYVDALIAIDPLFATGLGVSGHDGEWPDTGLAGAAARTQLYQRYRQALAAHLDDPDPIQRLAARALTQSMDDEIAAYEHDDHLIDLSHMASSFHRYRMVFDVMDDTTPDGWDAICSRLTTIDRAYRGLTERLEAGRAIGNTVARRQAQSVLEQATQLAGSGSAFESLEQRAATGNSGVAGLAEAVEHSKRAAGDFASYLKTTYLPHARSDDGVGAEMYGRLASRLVGVEVEPTEAYAWGWHELARLIIEAERVGDEIVPGGSLADVTELLETDPARASDSPEEFIAFIAERQERALAELDGVHFAVAEPLRTIDVRVAPAGGPLGAYYIRPSEDFTRPGGVWYSIGDQTTFPLYHHVSTAYHEGFPGHHLQNGTAMVNAHRISRGHRLTVWYPGYGEGWALYAERLMEEFGYLEVPDYVFGMVAKHLYRATRVVVDIGLHLGLRIPDSAPLFGGELWTFDRAVAYLETYGFRTPDQAVNETMRYLGWPGQAIAYKLGERELLRLRDDAKREAGPNFDLSAFHDRVIGNGPMRFDLLREVVLDRSAAH